jgi:chemotaxis protein methyltransferase CheR
MPQLAEQTISDDLLARFAALIYDVTGIRLSPQKKALLSNRLRRRLRATGIENFEEYWRHLRNLPAAHGEWNAFLQEITTHETFLFRDEPHWNWFRREYLPELAELAAKGRRNKSLRIWSAASSTGDEAFTIAACVVTSLPNYEQWQVKIVGTDIGVHAVEQATAATFGPRAMRLVPADVRQRCFTPVRGSEGDWQARIELRRMTSFRRHNLLEPLAEPPFDLVFLKNVLIYFDAQSKRTVVARVRELLRPGGLLVAGAAEGVSDYLKDCERRQAWLFRVPPRVGEGTS